MHINILVCSSYSAIFLESIFPVGSTKRRFLVWCKSIEILTAVVFMEEVDLVGQGCAKVEAAGKTSEDGGLCGWQVEKVFLGHLKL